MKALFNFPLLADMAEFRNLEGPQAGSAVAPQNSGFKVGSYCKVIEFKECPPQALNVLKKPDPVGVIEQDEVATLRQNFLAVLNNPDCSE